MSPTFDHGYALLIGVGKTQDQKWSLPATVADMQAIHTILVNPNLCAYPNDIDHVRLLGDETATRARILDNLEWLHVCANLDPECTIIVFFSGHGLLDRNTLQYYLVPNDYNALDIENTALSAVTFTDALRKISARRLLVIIDSCRAAEMASSKDGEPEEAYLDVQFNKQAPPTPVLTALKQGEGRAVFTSSRGQQSSYLRKDGKMSIYTYHFIEALHGAGNQPGDTEVRLSNIQNYVGKRVPAGAKEELGVEQTPFFDIAADDFPIALLWAGKGLPAAGWDAVSEEVSTTFGDLLRTYYQPKTEQIQRVEGSGIIEHSSQAAEAGISGTQIQEAKDQGRITDSHQGFFSQRRSKESGRRRKN